MFIAARDQVVTATSRAVDHPNGKFTAAPGARTGYRDA